MKVTTALRPGVAVDLELVRDVWMAWVRLPNLADMDGEELRRAHIHAPREAFLAEGPECAGIVRRALKPLEAELRRRGLEGDYRRAPGASYRSGRRSSR